MSQSLQPESGFRVVCLCAEWCGTCRGYRAGFDAMAEAFPGAEFLWLDVEDEGHPWSDWMADLAVENFPTVLIQRQDSVLFYGTMLPQHSLLKRTLESFLSQTPEESLAWSGSSPERLAWQATCRLPD